MAAHPGQSDHNSGGMMVFMGSVIFTVLFFLYIVFMSGGVNLNEMKAKAKAAAANAPAAVPAPPPASK